jgi:serine/threonine protein kinase
MDYDTRKVLGSGSFGTVFSGTFCGEHVAVKRIQIVNLDKREEEAMRKLNHRNVIRLLHTREEGEFK